MNISILGVQDERFHRPLRLIGNLFFEECEVMLGENDAADLTINLQLEHGKHIKAIAELSDKDGKNHSANFEKEFVPSETEKENFKQIKNAVSHVYLTVLQEWTGITQKWGILTGVRPTKLLHRAIQHQTPLHEAHQQLKEEYLITDEKIQLMQNIVDRQLAVVPDLYNLKMKSAYILAFHSARQNARIALFLHMRLMAGRVQ